MECIVDNQKYNLPDFLIVGAAKSGTSSLHFYLSEHKQVIMPEKIKELNFWHTYGHHDKRAILDFYPEMPRNIDDYVSFFKEKHHNELLGEISPSYIIYYEDTVNNLQSFYEEKAKKLKIVIILREPIDKIWSHYKFVKMYGLDPDNLSLKESILKEEERKKNNSLLPDLFYIDNTRYYKQVKYYLDNFEQVKILLYDELKKDTQSVLNEICDFLGIEHFTPENLNKKFNPSRTIIKRTKAAKLATKFHINKLISKNWKRKYRQLIYREEKMPESVHKTLKKVFKEEITKLNEIIDKDLSHWLKLYD